MRNVHSLVRVFALLAAVASMAVAGSAFGQDAPLGGTIGLTLTPSTTAPLPGVDFTMDLKVDATAATGTCTGPTTVPLTLGSWGLGISYDNTKLQYVSAASCGVAQFTNPSCNDNGSVVNCNDTNTGNTNQPQGNVCVARLTFRYISTSGSATPATLHIPSPRGVASNLIVACGGPATFSAASVTDGTSAAIAPSLPTAANNGPVCEGGTLNLTTPTVTGATYAWTGPNSFSSALQNPSIAGVTVAANGTYSVTTTVNGVTSGAGTTAASITAKPATPTAANNGPICVGSALNLTTPLVGGATYAWTGPNSFASALQNPTIPAATAAATGTYSVTVTVAGCTSTAGTTAATVNAIPGTPTAANNGPICAGSALNLSTPLVGGATYAWTGPNGFSSAAQNPTIPAATTAATGTYSVTVSVSGCVSSAGTTSATVNAIPATPTAANSGPICAGSTLNLTTPTVATASYLWVGPNSFSSALQNPTIPNATTAATGTYSVTITVSGCASAAGTTSATVNAIPATPTAANDGPKCVGSPLHLTTPTVAGATYAWTGPNSFSSAVQNPTIASPTLAASGTYSVTITVSGCASAAGTTTATVNAIPGTPTAANNGPICAGAALNLSTPTVAGATYSWTGPNSFVSATQNPSIASATTAATGTYSVTVTVGGCTSTAGTTAATVNADTAAPTVTAPTGITVTQTICCGTFGGVTPAGSGTLATYVGAGTATDDCDPSPTKLTAQVGGVNVANGTCFESGNTTVTFRFQDVASHIGTATSVVTVRMYADLNADNIVDPSDMVVLRAYFNFVIAPGTPPFNAPLLMADLTHNSVVDPSDFVIMRSYFNFVISCLAP